MKKNILLNDKYTLVTQPSFYKKGSIDMFNECIPTNTAFISFPDETIVFEPKEKTMSVPYAVDAIAQGIISETDIAIIEMVALLTFSTTRQITEILKLRGIDISYNRMQSAISRLNKYDMIRVGRFKSKDGVVSKSKVLLLDRFGRNVATERNIPYNSQIMILVTRPERIKRQLVANQLLLAYLKSGLNVNEFALGKIIKSDAMHNACVRFPLSLVIDDELYLFLIVRKGEDWKNELSDKLCRIQNILSFKEGLNVNLGDSPTLVIVGEDETHTKEIDEMEELKEIKELLSGELFYTYDLLQFGFKFKTSLYKYEGDSKEFYQLPVFDEFDQCVSS